MLPRSTGLLTRFCLASISGLQTGGELMSKCLCVDAILETLLMKSMTLTPRDIFILISKTG